HHRYHANSREYPDTSCHPAPIQRSVSNPDHKLSRRISSGGKLRTCLLAYSRYNQVASIRLSRKCRFPRAEHSTVSVPFIRCPITQSQVLGRDPWSYSLRRSWFGIRAELARLSRPKLSLDRDAQERNSIGHPKKRSGQTDGNPDHNAHHDLLPRNLLPGPIVHIGTCPDRSDFSSYSLSVRDRTRLAISWNDFDRSRRKKTMEHQRASSFG